MNKNKEQSKISKSNLSTKQKCIILFLLLISFFAGVLFIRDKKQNSFSNPYPLIDPSRNLIDQEHFFSTIEPLRKDLKEIVAKHEKEGSKIGVYFEFLNTGANVSINQESRFWPASLSKMPTAFVVMKKIELGEWKLDNELILYYEDRNDAFGDLYKKQAGTRLTIEELLKELIINSDDTAHRMLIRNLEGEDFEQMLSALGMEDLYNKDYDITAKEYSRIMRSLYTSSFLKREYSTMLLTWLSETPFDDFLGGEVPKNVIFSHKIGEHDPGATYLDSGIVYFPNRPYLLTAMIDTKNSGGREKAKEIMKELSKASYDYVSNY